VAIKVAALAVEIIRGGQPDRVKRDLKDVDRAGAKAGKSVIGLNTALKAVGIGFSVAGITRGLRSAAGAFLDFDAAMVESLAIMGDVSAGMRSEMAEAAKHVAKITTFSATEAAQSYYYLASAGLDAQQSIAALPQVAKFAQAGAFDMARATDLATDAQSALGLTVDNVAQNLTNLTRVTDVLVKANTVANAKTEEFSESLTNKAGAALKAVGKDIEEGVAVLAAFADQGIKGAEAGTALDIVFRELQDKASKNAEAFAALGVSVFDANGEMRNAADIIGDLERALAGMSDEQKVVTLAQLGFTSKSVSFIKTILGQSEAIRGYEVQLRSAAGTTEEVANNQLQSLKAQLKLTTDTLNTMITTMVEAVVPMLGFEEGLADIRTELEGMERAMVNNGKEIAKWVTGFVAIATTIASVVRVVENSFDFLGQVLLKTLADVTFQIGRMINTLVIGPINAALEFIRSPIMLVRIPIEDAAAASEKAAADMIKDAHDIRDAIDDAVEAWAKFALAQEGFSPEPARPGPPPRPPPPPGLSPPPGPIVLPGITVPGLIGTSMALPSTGAASTGAAWNISDMLDAQMQNLRAGELFKLATAETLAMIGEMGDAIESGLEQTLGDAIANGLEAAFDTGNLMSFFEHFGKTLLAGFGDILVQLGQILIQYGITMEALRPFLMNIFTAGPAAIAAGVALIALGSAFTSISSSSGGGVGRGTATAGAFREPSYGFSQQQSDVSRRTISMGAPPAVQPQQPINFFNTIIGPDDPIAQRQITELVVKAQRRGLVLVP
jgi:TP901 family phage tail tape measure protein